MSDLTPKDVVAEMFERQQAGDDSYLDDLVAADIINHAAGPQGRAGLRNILTKIDHDLGPISYEQHHLIGDGDLVANTSRRTAPTGHRPCRFSLTSPSPGASWSFIHIWRVANGVIVEHWACRDDMGLREQVSL